MIKIITFWIGVDVLGFPLLHEHRLKFKQPSKYIIGYDPVSGNETHSIGVTTYNSGRIVFHNKNNLKK